MRTIQKEDDQGSAKAACLKALANLTTGHALEVIDDVRLAIANGEPVIFVPPAKKGQ